MEIIRLKPGENCPPAQSGDFLLVRGTGFVSKVINLFGQYYTHVVSVTEFPYVADALAQGVVENHIDRYRDKYRVLVRIDASNEDRKQMLRFLDSVLVQKWNYNYLGLLITGLMILTGGGLSVRHNNTSYCSGLAAEAIVRTGEIFKKSPNAMNPDDLAEHYGV